MAWRPNLIYIVLCGLLGGTNALYMGFCGWSGDHITVSYSMWEMRGKNNFGSDSVGGMDNEVALYGVLWEARRLLEYNLPRNRLVGLIPRLVSSDQTSIP